MIQCYYCNELVPDDELITCPECGKQVCERCFDGIMCEDCREIELVSDILGAMFSGKIDF